MQQATAAGPTSLEWFTAIVAAVSALAAFAAAVVATINLMKTNGRYNEEVTRAAKQRALDERDARLQPLRVDARGVHSQYNPNSPAILVQNDSPYAIYHVKADLFARDDPGCNGVRVLWRDTEWMAPRAGWDAFTSGDLNALKETGWSVDQLPNVRLTWTDSAGVRWVRMPDFTLEPIEIPA